VAQPTVASQSTAHSLSPSLSLSLSLGRSLSLTLTLSLALAPSLSYRRPTPFANQTKVDEFTRLLLLRTLQGYLAHKNQPPPLGSPYDPSYSSTVGS